MSGRFTSQVLSPTTLHPGCLCMMHRAYLRACLPGQFTCQVLCPATLHPGCPCMVHRRCLRACACLCLISSHAGHTNPVLSPNNFYSFVAFRLCLKCGAPKMMRGLSANWINIFMLCIAALTRHETLVDIFQVGLVGTQCQADPC